MRNLTKKRKKFIRQDYCKTLKIVRRNLIKEKKNQGLTWSDLSKKSGLSIPELKSIFYNDPNPGISVLLFITNVLNLQSNEIFLNSNKGKNGNV